VDVGTAAQVLVLGLAFGGLYALIASGLTLSYAVTRHINVAHGDFLALGLYMLFSVCGTLGLDPYLALFVVAPILFVLGFVVFRLFLRPVVHTAPIVVFQLFIGMGFIIQSGLNIIYTGNALNIPSAVALHKLYLGPVVVRTADTLAFGVSVVVCVGFYWLLRSTEFGRVVRAVAQRPDVAPLMGIDIRWVQGWVFALSFLLLAIAAALSAPILVLRPSMGLEISLYALIILILGGMGHFVGALLGAFIIGIATAASLFVWGTSMSAAVPFAIFVVILLLRPQGMFGAR
jgi:branched-chain amino acid transport system permease protein